MKAWVLFLALFLIAGMAVGQTESLPIQEGINTAVLAPEIEGNSVIVALKKLDSKMPMGISAWALMAIGFLVELLVRFLPTKKPRSILLLVAASLNILGSIFTKSSALLDKVAQKVKDK